ncbi:TPA: hypothetical protein ACGSTL_001324 [Vibrio parahaemolyticus]|uniref:hypothetical protein n=1 Tax=Vibrio campbellii TaxID=680 RepID=UPI001F087A76|nr:hypothetical protein [Vibrio campbellii]UMM06769.1 hypothetical protein MKR81_26275 [Vibrio campbellii]
MSNNTANFVNSSSSKNAKKTAAYLKRRASRLRKKSNFARTDSVREGLLHMAERATLRANELYFASC